MGLLPIPIPVDKKVRVSSNDTTSGFLNGKLVAGTGITLTENLNGKNETLGIATSITQYTDELAQDAIGAMIDTSLVYVDGTPLLTRAALTGEVTASQGSNALTIANDAVTYAKMQNMATATILGRNTVGSGDIEEITDIPTAITIGSAYIYRVSGTDVSVADGGTNSSAALTNQKVMTSVGGAIVESGAITDGEGIQRNNTTFISAPLPLGTCEGRLTLTSGTAITTADVTAAGTIYFALYKGDRIYLYDGTRWKLYSFTERSLALTLTDANNYDVFIYDNAGTLTLELSAAWTTDTARADALTTQNGIYVKSGATTRRYLGTIRASGTNTTEDSILKRYVWNYYNRIPRYLYKNDSTNHTYGTATNRFWNNDSTNKLQFVVGVVEETVFALNTTDVRASVDGFPGYTSMGLDTATTVYFVSIGSTFTGFSPGSHGGYISHAIGYHFISMIEYGNATNAPSFPYSTCYGLIKG